jgi:hypothetical protein
VRRAPRRKPRASGYHYEMGADGRKHRVYDSSAAPAAAAPAPRKRGNKFLKSFLGPVAKAAGVLGSGFLGNLEPAFGALAGAAAKGISSITGQGDYTEIPNTLGVRSNTLMGLQSSQVPYMHTDGSGAVRVKHREYIGDINMTATNFVTNPIPINAGNTGCFPWLARGLSKSFEQYKIMGMIFEFKSTSADSLSSVTPALGTVMMGTQYNVVNSPFPDKQSLLNHQWSTSSKPSESFVHCIECEPNQTPIAPLYIRQVEQVPGVAYDARLYDHARLEIATSGGSSPTLYPCGELWVTYDIILFKPRLGRLSAGLFVDPPKVLDPFPPPDDIHVPEDPTLCCETKEEEEKREHHSAFIDDSLARLIADFEAYKLAHP